MQRASRESLVFPAFLTSLPRLTFCLREVRVLTAQQRMTGNILAGMPILLAVALSVISPGYFDAFFEEGWVRLLPLGAAVMMVLGFVFIRKIVNIKV